MKIHQGQRLIHWITHHHTSYKTKLVGKSLLYGKQNSIPNQHNEWRVSQISTQPCRYFSSKHYFLARYQNGRKDTARYKNDRKDTFTQSSTLSLTAETLMRTNKEVLNSSAYEKKEIEEKSHRLEDLEDLFNSSLALDKPGAKLIVESEISHDEISQFVHKKKTENIVKYGQEEGCVENVIGTEYSSQKILSSGLDNNALYLYGSPDPNVPVSKTPCSGCGAALHCHDPAIPGYMPSQKFVAIPKKDMRNQICQRCYMLQEHSLALNVNVQPSVYTDIVGQIKNKKALVVLVVDVTDFPNSMYKDILKLIGYHRPVIVIGNKIDLLPKDKDGYLQRTEEMITNYLNKKGFSQTNYIKHVCLVSAKTGYGIEDLVSTMIKVWYRKGDVYVVGSTNVGKSTLFNALLSSDYCKNTARDFINRATISNWPGTTLNTLKFPIINPAGWRLKKRSERLVKQTEDAIAEAKLKKSMKKGTRQKFEILMGHVGQTFLGVKQQKLDELDYQGYSGAMYSLNEETGSFSSTSSSNHIEAVKKKVKKEIDESYDERLYANSGWFHDTPGVVNPEQVINLLNPQELIVMLSERLIYPRTFRVMPGYTMYVAGIGRLDYLQGACGIYFTVFCSIKLPIHVKQTSEADDFYIDNIGTDVFEVPSGDQDRLNKLPSLVGRQFDITGIGWNESIGDILLSSLGWVSITAGTGIEVSIRAYTPGGYGCQLRSPALLYYAVNQRGRKVKGTSAYNLKRPVV